MAEREQLEQAIAALEAQRDVLGDAVVEAGLTPMREKLAALAETGTPTSELQGERRLATVILADVKGSTNLVERIGTEAWVEIMNRVFQILGSEIYRFGGEVDQFRGDGLVAFFGATTAHEDDPERAVLSALAMQEAIHRYAAELAEREGIELLLRVGVNTGEVIAASVGDVSQHREDTAMGEAIALAARMESAAEPGTVLVSEHTYRLVQSLFEWQPLGKIIVKGVSQPVTVYRPLAAKAVVGKLRGIAGLTSPLVGRRAEFYALQEAANSLRAGVGGIVTVVGEAGIGKSRLVAELCRRELGAEGEALQWVEGRCLSYGTTIAYLLWLDVLRGLLWVTVEDSPVAVRNVLEERVRALCPERFDDVYPYLGRLLSLPLESDEETMLRGLGAEGLKVGTFRAVETLVECTAQQQPLVVVCEDLHWADPTSLELLEQLLALTDHAPLLPVCVFRPETEHGCWRIKETAARRYRHRHTDLRLDPLSAAEIKTLVGNLLRVEDLPQEFRGRILSHAEGNPFYVEEIIRSLIDSGAVVHDETTGRWQATGDIADITIPDTLHGVLMARIDRLQSETKRVLQLASVIGRVFFHRVLAAIAREKREIDAHLLTLQREQMIRERARIPELEYIFKHQLTQEAAYNGLLKKDRRIYHRQVAEALEQLYPERIEEQVGLLAHHWERAEEPEKAIAYLLRAGDQARLAYANEEAIGYYHRALALLDEFPVDKSRKDWRLEALKGLGQIYFGTGKVAEAEERFREAITLGQEMRLPPRDLVRLYYWLGEVLYWQDRHEDRMRIGEEGLALLGADTESVEAALMNQTIAVGCAEKGNREKFLEFTYRTAQFIQRLPYSQELRPAYDHIVMAYAFFDKNVAEATKWLQALERRAAQHHDLRALGEVHFYTGNVLAATGDLHGAVSRRGQALELSTRIGDAKLESWCLRDMGATFLSLGDVRKAEAYASKGLETARAVGNKGNIALAYWNVGQSFLCQGAWEKAVVAFQKAIQHFRESGNRLEEVLAVGQTWVTYALGRVYLAQGDREEAIKQFQETVAPATVALASLVPLREIIFAFAGALSGLEEAYGDAAVFHTFCRRFREKHYEVTDSPFVQWFLEPTEPLDFPPPLGPPRRNGGENDEFDESLSSDWVWQDPFDDCSFTVQSGLEIHAANGRDLWYINLSAPRMLRPVSGDFATQTVCVPVSGEKPAIGGILLWKDRKNWLRLDRGALGAYEISFRGCLGNKDLVFGRGCLPSDRVYLRLERLGRHVSALCSVDGVEWFTVGHVEFPDDDPVEVGLHATGNIDRLIYHGAYPDGTAIRFESFQLWGT